MIWGVKRENWGVNRISLFKLKTTFTTYGMCTCGILGCYFIQHSKGITLVPRFSLFEAYIKGTNVVVMQLFIAIILLTRLRATRILKRDVW